MNTINYNALPISSDEHFQIHLKPESNACFTNNYLNERLISWKANIDIQPVFNHYKVATYMCAYFSKAEDGTSQVMEEACKDAFNRDVLDCEKMKVIAKAYTTKTECSVQEAVYMIMPELWLQKTFSKVMFLNSCLPECLYGIFRKKEELDKLPDDSADIFQRNMLDRYTYGPDSHFQNGKYAILENLCFAEFLSFYYVESKINETSNYNDSQPVVLNDEVVAGNHRSCIYPKSIPLMSPNEKLKCKTLRVILRYHEPNPDKYPEKYAHRLLFTFYPFRNEDNLKLDGCCFAKLKQSGVLDIINLNRQKLNPHSELVNNALLNLQTDVRSTRDFNHENYEIEQNVLNCVDSLCEDEYPLSENTVMNTSEIPLVVLDEEFNEHIRFLNKKQREGFDTAYPLSIS